MGGDVCANILLTVMAGGSNNCEYYYGKVSICAQPTLNGAHIQDLGGGVGESGGQVA